MKAQIVSLSKEEFLLLVCFIVVCCIYVSISLARKHLVIGDLLVRTARIGLQDRKSV